MECDLYNINETDFFISVSKYLRRAVTLVMSSFGLHKVVFHSGYSITGLFLRVLNTVFTWLSAIAPLKF